MRTSTLGMCLLLACFATSADSYMNETVLRSALQLHFNNDLQLLNALDSTRRLNPFGDLQVTLLAGGGHMGRGQDQTPEFSTGTVRGNGQYMLGRDLRAGLDLSLGTAADAAASSEFSTASMFASGLYDSWHWDATVSRQWHRKLPYATQIEGDGWSLQTIGGYDFGALNPRWHYGPALGIALDQLTLVDDSPSDLSLTAVKLVSGLFTQWLSRDKTLSLSLNIAAYGEVDRRQRGGEDRQGTYKNFTGRINLTYAPNPLARFTLQSLKISGSGPGGQHLLIGVIYHL